MIQQLIQHLDSLQLDLAAVDPAHDTEAADRVAAIVLALRRAAVEDRSAPQAGASGTSRDAA